MSTFGKFELLTCLAKGGMAEVYLARHSGEGRFERLLVIKRILPQFADDETFIDLFLEEARIAALLDHPHVIPIYDFGRVDETYFIAMPYVHGLSVQTMLRERGAMRLDVACEIVRQTLTGLDYVHRCTSLDDEPLHLVHRDISPANLMINDQGRVLLLDFGVASVADSATLDSSSLRGKLSYMSPEQIHGAELDHRSDLFSVGVVFCELLMGTRLFKRDNDPEIIRAITEEPIPDPAALAPDLPKPIAEIIRRALARERDDRFPTAGHMRGLLEAAMQQLEMQTSETSLSDHLEHDHGDSLAAQGQVTHKARHGLLAGESETIVDIPKQKKRKKGATSAKWLRPTIVVLLVIMAIAAGLFAWSNSRIARPSGEPLTIALTPYLPEDVLTEDFAPLLRYLERETGRPFRSKVALNYEQAAQLLLEEDDVQLAELTAYPFILARRRDPNIQLLATPISQQVRTYESYFVVRRDGGLDEFQHLKGKRVCYVDRTSTSGYLMPRAVVRKAGYDPDEFFSSVQFSGNHLRALRDLLAERCDVATVTSPAYLTARSQDIEIAKVRILKVSPSLPNGVFCAASSVPPVLANKIADALYSMNFERELGRSTLSKVLPLSGFTRVAPDAFDELAREVDLIGVTKTQ